MNWSDDKFYESARSLFNDISIVVKITFDYKGVRETFLFPGDLTNWSLLMATYPKIIKKCITKIPHHGSNIYIDAIDFNNSLFITSLSSKQWKRYPPPFYFYYDVLHDLYLKYGEIPLPLMPIHGVDFHILSKDMDSMCIYNYIKPKHSLIYPYRRKSSLPRLDVRNAIIANSSRTSCNFKQGKVTMKKWAPDMPCMDCYSCNERNKATTFNWSEKFKVVKLKLKFN
jgi:hypothetical protein